MFSEAFPLTFEQRPQTIFLSCSWGKHRSAIVRWITHELILWTLLSVDSLVTTKHKKCVFQFSENWAFLCPIKPILREWKLLWSHLIRTNDRCCKQPECFNSDLRHWFHSPANYCVDWGYAFSQSSGRRLFSFLSSVLFCSWKCGFKWTLTGKKKIKVEIISLDSLGPSSGCQAAQKGVCLDIKWLLIVGNDTVCGRPNTSESSNHD